LGFVWGFFSPPPRGDFGANFFPAFLFLPRGHFRAFSPGQRRRPGKKYSHGKARGIFFFFPKTKKKQIVRHRGGKKQKKKNGGGGGVKKIAQGGAFFFTEERHLSYLGGGVTPPRLRQIWGELKQKFSDRRGEAGSPGLRGPPQNQSTGEWADGGFRSRTGVLGSPAGNFEHHFFVQGAGQKITFPAGFGGKTFSGGAWDFKLGGPPGGVNLGVHRRPFFGHRGGAPFVKTNLFPGRGHLRGKKKMWGEQKGGILILWGIELCGKFSNHFFFFLAKGGKNTAGRPFHPKTLLSKGLHPRGGGGGGGKNQGNAEEKGGAGFILKTHGWGGEDRGPQPPVSARPKAPKNKKGGGPGAGLFFFFLWKKKTGGGPLFPGFPNLAAIGGGVLVRGPGGAKKKKKTKNKKRFVAGGGGNSRNFNDRPKNLSLLFFFLFFFGKKKN